MAYEDFFGFKEAPFRLSPDPDYYFPSGMHGEALQNLIYSIRAGEGFVQITGNPGTGKTLILRMLLKQIGSSVHTALILYTKIAAKELFRVILEDLGIDSDQMENKSQGDLLRFFRKFLLEEAEKGIPTVIIIDEAQNLPNDVLEELRLLSNLETEKKKLLQIILVGQLELEEKLECPDLKQLHQRITIRYRLQPLSESDTVAYIKHRLQIAGNTKKVRFPSKVIKKIYKLSGGVPRLINIICERALMAAFVQTKNIIETGHVKKAIESISGEQDARSIPAKLRNIAIFLMLAVLISGGVYLFPSIEHSFEKFFHPQKEIVSDCAQNDVVKKVVSSDSKSNKTVPPSSNDIQPSKQKSPVDAFYFSSNMFFISVDRDEKKARVLRQDETSLNSEKEFFCDWPLTDGLFILSNDNSKHKFIFSQDLLFDSVSYDEAALNLWNEAGEFVIGNTIPVFAYSSKKETDLSFMREKAYEVKEVVNSWANAWKNMDIDEYMTFYKKGHILFCAINQKPKLYSWERIYEIKKKVFLKTDFIDLHISDPVCTIIPNNPKEAIAIFHQKYKSSIFSDEGIKALYFRLIDDSEGNSSWKIISRLWMPQNKNP